MWVWCYVLLLELLLLLEWMNYPSLPWTHEGTHTGSGESSRVLQHRRHLHQPPRLNCASGYKGRHRRYFIFQICWHSKTVFIFLRHHRHLVYIHALNISIRRQCIMMFLEEIKKISFFSLSVAFRADKTPWISTFYFHCSVSDELEDDEDDVWESTDFTPSFSPFHRHCISWEYMFLFVGCWSSYTATERREQTITIILLFAAEVHHSRRHHRQHHTSAQRLNESISKLKFICFST